MWWWSPARDRCDPLSFSIHRVLLGRPYNKHHAGTPVSSVDRESEVRGRPCDSADQGHRKALQGSVSTWPSPWQPHMVHSRPRTSGRLSLHACLSPSTHPRPGRGPLHHGAPSPWAEAGSLRPTEAQGAQSTWDRDNPPRGRIGARVVVSVRKRTVRETRQPPRTRVPTVPAANAALSAPYVDNDTDSLLLSWRLAAILTTPWGTRNQKVGGAGSFQQLGTVERSNRGSGEAGQDGSAEGG